MLKEVTYNAVCESGSTFFDAHTMGNDFVCCMTRAAPALQACMKSFVLVVDLSTIHSPSAVHNLRSRARCDAQSGAAPLLIA